MHLKLLLLLLLSFAASGAELFECLLLDADEAVNYVNWNYFAGVGNDPRNRQFKTVTQVGGCWRVHTGGAGLRRLRPRTTYCSMCTLQQW